MKQGANKTEPKAFLADAAGTNGFVAHVVSANGTEPSSERRVLRSARLLWAKRNLLGRALAIGGLCGCIAAFLLPVEYQSSVQLMPPDQGSGSEVAMLAALSGKMGPGMGALAGDLAGVKSSGALFVGILHSRTVENRIVENFGLRKIYGVKLHEDARAKLSENTVLSEDRKSGIITIEVTDRNAKRAAVIAQAYVEELNQLVAELSTSAAHRERVFLEGRLRSVKGDLDEASQAFSQFASKNQTLDIKEQGRAMVQGAASVQGELIAVESELKGLEEIYAPGNVRVRELRARRDELKRQLEKLAGSAISDVDQPGKLSEIGYPSISKLPLLGVPYADLYRQMQIQEAVYETLTQQLELAKVQEAKETPSVKVLDSANEPERKSFPPRFLIVMLSGVLSIGATAAAVLARAKWNEVDPMDEGRLFADEVMHSMNGLMPWATPNGSRVRAMSHRVWLRVVKQEKAEKSADVTAN